MTDYTSSSSSSSSELPAFLPSFLWVLRDFALELRDPEDGSRLSAKDYLEQSLMEDESSFREDTLARNRVRRSLKEFFRRRDCALLRRPTESEEDLQRLDGLSQGELRPAFRRGLRDLWGQLFGRMLEPKRLYGEAVTGRALAGLATAYVAAINNNAVPSITGAWEGVAEAECAEARRAAEQVLERAAEDLRRTLPIGTSSLLEALDGAREHTMRAFKDRAIGGEAARTPHV